MSYLMRINFFFAYYSISYLRRAAQPTNSSTKFCEDNIENLRDNEHVVLVTMS